MHSDSVPTHVPVISKIPFTYIGNMSILLVYTVQKVNGGRGMVTTPRSMILIYLVVVTVPLLPFYSTVPLTCYYEQRFHAIENVQHTVNKIVFLTENTEDEEYLHDLLRSYKNFRRR